MAFSFGGRIIMEDKKINPPVTFNLDSIYAEELIDRKKNIRDGDLDHAFSRLANLEIYLLAINLAIKNKLKPKNSKSSQTYVRTEAFVRDPESFSILKSLIYQSKKDILILTPENYPEFFKHAERLANAGMPKALEVLREDKKDVEKRVLLDEKKIKINL